MKKFTRSKVRAGAAFVLLVFLILLVVLGATRSMLLRESADRRGEQDRMRSRVMATAIESAQPIAGDLSTPVKFPLESPSGEFIEVSIHPDKSRMVAKWHRGDRVIDQLTREIENSELNK